MTTSPNNASPIVEVQAAWANRDGLHLRVNNLTCGVDSKRAFLDLGICILLDQEESGDYFSRNFKAHWPGDPTDSSNPLELLGGVLNETVTFMMEEYLARIASGAVELDGDVQLPVPASEWATDHVGILRAARWRRAASRAR